VTKNPQRKTQHDVEMGLPRSSRFCSEGWFPAGRQEAPRIEEMNMRYMVIVKANERSEAGELPSEQELVAMG
jgi:hypothetical protein